MKFYVKALTNYFNIKERATQQEFWMFILFNLIFTIIAQFLDYFLYVAISYNFRIPFFGFGYLTFVYLMWVIIPGFTISVRRLHDINKSGTHLLLALIPIVGGLILLVFYCTASYPIDNKWGTKKD